MELSVLWLLVLLFVICYAPSIIAWNRNVKGLGIIIILNFVFSWHPVAWLILFLWSIFGETNETVRHSR